jgi:uncharacterized protein
MRGLLDANVLIALIDADHTFHERAHKWLDANIHHGWSSCPLTENAVVRVMSNPNYFSSIRHTPKDLIGRLRTFVEHADHCFWPDEISLRDPKIFAANHIHSPRQLTDLYLLALATRHQGRLVTFDQSINLSAVNDAKGENLCIV